MQFDRDAQAISDAFDLLADPQRPEPYAVANDYVSAEMYAGSIFEAAIGIHREVPGVVRAAGLHYYLRSLNRAMVGIVNHAA